ncbi:unnamed protein product [Cyclocybe aegerita]|uniref:DUF6533 domain-containing protein n=1 Tax=Cyclocybe aegerita TaxID=1973307 RepID=A0A8S0WQY3_CYCAE|nr:unnamed protein product [Cyclocybe aegerita]
MDDISIERMRISTALKMVDVAACTVFIWDYLLTLGMEVEYVWPGRWTIIKAVYLLQRYLPFIDTLWIALHVLFGTNLSPTMCSRLNAAGRSLMCLGLASSELILTLRAWAVWDRNRDLGIILQILFAACFLPTAPILYVFLKSVEYIDLPPPTEGCIPVAGKQIIIVNWALLLVWDALILILMAIPAFHSFRFKNNSSLYRAVYTEGISYYLYLFIISTLNIVLSGLTSVDMSYRFVVITMSRCFHSLLTSRVLLHIRASNDKDMAQESTEVVLVDMVP